MVDVSKAFDHIHHATLLDKLKTNGVPSEIFKWYKGCLTDRQQQVKMRSVTSEWRTVNGGVPQGTISSPELFIHMVSDLHTDIPDVKYMDNTTLIEIAKKQSGSSKQHATEQVHELSCTNKLGINATKNKEILIKRIIYPILINTQLTSFI